MRFDPRRRSLRWPTFVVALCALLLQAAAPMLAQAAADAQGKTLFEVCTAYGVRTVAADGSLAPAGSEDSGSHAVQHAPCVLTALPLLTLPPPAAEPLPRRPALRGGVVESVQAAPARPDPAARWQARRKQGPPAA